MDSRPIGLFDSGIGGLTGLKALRRELPGEDLIYFADTGRMPYGPRPLPALRAIAVQDLLASFGVKAILSACGTISSAAVRELAGYPIPAFGVLHPAIEAMAKVPGQAPLAIIATAASIKSGQFTAPLRERCPGRRSAAGTSGRCCWAAPTTASSRRRSARLCPPCRCCPPPNAGLRPCGIT